MQRKNHWRGGCESTGMDRRLWATELAREAAWKKIKKKKTLVVGLVLFVGGFFPHFTEPEDQVLVHFLSKST